MNMVKPSSVVITPCQELKSRKRIAGLLAPPSRRVTADKCAAPP
jgi:hypothetical protein